MKVDPNMVTDFSKKYTRFGLLKQKNWREKIVDFIALVQPDIVLFQELDGLENQNCYYYLSDLVKKLNSK